MMMIKKRQQPQPEGSGIATLRPRDRPFGEGHLWNNANPRVVCLARPVARLSSIWDRCGRRSGSYWGGNWVGICTVQVGPWTRWVSSVSRLEIDFTVGLTSRVCNQINQLASFCTIFVACFKWNLTPELVFASFAMMLLNYCLQPLPPSAYL